MNEITRKRIVDWFPWALLFLWIAYAEFTNVRPADVKKAITSQLVPEVKKIQTSISESSKDRTHEHSEQVKELTQEFKTQLADKDKEVIHEIDKLRNSTVDLLGKPEELRTHLEQVQADALRAYINAKKKVENVKSGYRKEKVSYLQEKSRS